METDLKSIERFANIHADENWDFLVSLKDIDTEYLNTLILELFSRVSSEIDCTQCGNCCRELSPSLTQTEIQHLSERIKMTSGQFESEYIDVDMDGIKRIKQIPCPFLENNRCVHYELRPADCVSYPHLNEKKYNDLFINLIENYPQCPIVFNVLEELKNHLKCAGRE